MVDDPRRTSAYLAALRDTVRPSDHVLEIGTGFGFFAVHAALAGAAHVWAVEPNDAIALGPALAARHGVADRITFLQLRADQVTLPRPANVLLEDLRGVFPLMGARAAVLADARSRLLAADSRSIALRDHLVVAPCAAVDTIGPRDTTLDLGEVRTRAAHGWRRVAARALQPVAVAARWASIDLTAAIPAAVHGVTENTVTTAGEIGGVGAWFEAELAGGHGFGSGPDHGPSVYDCAWFPLAASIPVEVGDTVRISMRAAHDGSDYVWRWDVRATSARRGETVLQSGSDLDAHLISSERRARRASSAVPSRDAAHDVFAALLAHVDGQHALGAIAAALRAEFPQRFATERTALDFAAGELARLTEGDLT